MQTSDVVLVVSQAGKTQGQYHNWFHVKNLDNGMLKSVDFSQVEWSKAEEEVYYNASNSDEVAHAQVEELAKWKQYGVCTEVEEYWTTCNHHKMGFH